jgi:hypothetical protein
MVMKGRLWWRSTAVMLVILAAACSSASASGRGSESPQTHAGTADATADTETQVALRRAIVASKTVEGDRGSLEGIELRDLASLDGSLCLVAGNLSAADGTCATGTGPVVVSVAFHGPHAVAAAALSSSGTCFWVRDDGFRSQYGTVAACSGAEALTASPGAAGWGNDGA